MENRTSKKKYGGLKKENGFQTSGEETTAKTHAQYLDALNEEIQDRAHAIYLARRGKPGSPLSDWLQAEKEIQEKYGTSRFIQEGP